MKQTRRRSARQDRVQFGTRRRPTRKSFGDSRSVRRDYDDYDAYDDFEEAPVRGRRSRRYDEDMDPRFDRSSRRFDSRRRRLLDEEDMEMEEEDMEEDEDMDDDDMDEEEASEGKETMKASKMYRGSKKTMKSGKRRDSRWGGRRGGRTRKDSIMRQIGGRGSNRPVLLTADHLEEITNIFANVKTTLTKDVADKIAELGAAAEGKGEEGKTGPYALMIEADVDNFDLSLTVDNPTISLSGGAYDNAPVIAYDISLPIINLATFMNHPLIAAKYNQGSAEDYAIELEVEELANVEKVVGEVLDTLLDVITAKSAVDTQTEETVKMLTDGKLADAVSQDSIESVVIKFYSSDVVKSIELCDDNLIEYEVDYDDELLTPGILLTILESTEGSYDLDSNCIKFSSKTVDTFKGSAALQEMSKILSGNGDVEVDD